MPAVWPASMKPAAAGAGLVSSMGAGRAQLPLHLVKSPPPPLPTPLFLFLKPWGRAAPRAAALSTRFPITGCGAAGDRQRLRFPCTKQRVKSPTSVQTPEQRSWPQHRWRKALSPQAPASPRKTLHSLQFRAVHGNGEPSSRSFQLRAVVHHARSQEGYGGMGSSGRSLQRKGASKLA